MARNRYDMDEILEDSFDVNHLNVLQVTLLPTKRRWQALFF